MAFSIAMVEEESDMVDMLDAFCGIVGSDTI
jgi:hypothetical protein